MQTQPTVLALIVALGTACSTQETPSTPGEPDRAQPVASASPTIDRLVEAQWSDQIHVAELADDGELCRRASLDIIGRIPTPDELDRFLDDQDPQKRANLIDRLLASPDYAEHWGDVYADLLLGSELGQNRRVRDDGRAWLVGQLAAGRPYDEMVRDMLTVNGELPDVGAGGFLLVHGRRDKIAGITGATARAFLGVQIQCAQCHDHPYDDRYRQRDFYALGAYFARTRLRNRRDGDRRIPRIVDRPRGEIRVPGDDVVVAPQFLGRSVEPAAGETRRETLVRAMLDSDLFAKAAVGHTWSRMFGRAPLEPWDNLGGENDPSHPELLSALARDFVANGYDHRHLIRTIALSSAYQRSSKMADAHAAAGAEQVFARAAIRPMTAEQLFRSLLDATGLEGVAARGFRARVRRRKRRALREYRFVFNDDEMGQADSFDGTTAQALLLLNGEVTNRGVVARRGTRLDDILSASAGRDDRIEALYLALFSRKPSPAELAARADFIAGHGDLDEAYEDLMFALLMSSEFLTIH